LAAVRSERLVGAFGLLLRLGVYYYVRFPSIVVPITFYLRVKICTRVHPQQKFRKTNFSIDLLTSRFANRRKSGNLWNFGGAPGLVTPKACKPSCQPIHPPDVAKTPFCQPMHPPNEMFLCNRITDIEACSLL